MQQTANELHQRIGELIDLFTLNVNEDMESTIIMTMTAMYYEKNKEGEEQSLAHERQLDEIDKKIKRLEERYVLEEIDQEMFLRFRDYSGQKSGKLPKMPLKIKMGCRTLKSASSYDRKRVRGITFESDSAHWVEPGRSISNFFVDDLRVIELLCHPDGNS